MTLPSVRGTVPFVSATPGPPDPYPADSGDHEDGCATCSEMPGELLGECPQSRRPCGHHCNCSWIHDSCHWCGIDLKEIE